MFVGAVRYLPCAGAPVGEGGDDEAARILALRRRAGYAPNPQSGHGVHGVFARLPCTMAPRGAARALRRRPARVVRTWRRGATARRTLLRADVPRNSCPSRASSPFGGGLVGCCIPRGKCFPIWNGWPGSSACPSRSSSHTPIRSRARTRFSPEQGSMRSSEGLGQDGEIDATPTMHLTRAENIPPGLYWRDRVRTRFPRRWHGALRWTVGRK